MRRELRVHPLEGIPLIRPGDPLPRILTQALREARLDLRNGDILVVTQKIVSKAEGRLVRLAEVTPSGRALDLAAKLGKDPRKVEVILRESRRVLRAERSAGTGLGVLICETRHGLVCANAGVDESNLDDPDTVLTLPADPDASAEAIRRDVTTEIGVELGVLITDSFGRPWRLGIINVAIGVAGFAALVDLRGQNDYAGRPLTITEAAVADELAAVAGLAMGKLEQIPAVLIQGADVPAGPGRASDLLRPDPENLFR